MYFDHVVDGVEIGLTCCTYAMPRCAVEEKALT